MSIVEHLPCCFMPCLKDVASVSSWTLIIAFFAWRNRAFFEFSHSRCILALICQVMVYVDIFRHYLLQYWSSQFKEANHMALRGNHIMRMLLSSASSVRTRKKRAIFCSLCLFDTLLISHFEPDKTDN